MQSKRHSLIEALVNVGSGMVIAFLVSQGLVQLSPFISKYIRTGFYVSMDVQSNIIVTIVLTLVSVLRSYVWRRYFNKKILKRYNSD